MKWKMSTSWRAPLFFDDPDELARIITEDCDYINELDPDEDAVFDYDGQVDVLGVTYWPSEILKAIDEDRYNEMLDNERSYMAENNKDEISRDLQLMVRDQTESYPGSIRVTCIEDEDDDEESEIEENEDLVEILDYVV